MPPYKSILQPVSVNDWNKAGVKVSVLREDLIHPYISGNKWRKLKYNLIDFNKSGKKVIVTFGGAFSNHLMAVAAASKEFGFEAIGIVRGEKVENEYLNFAASQGMKFCFISRDDFRNKKSEKFTDDLMKKLSILKLINNKEEVFMIPEGGSNLSAVKGTAEIMDEIPESTQYIACACGTGGTIAGISTRLSAHQKVIGISVLKAYGYFEKEIAELGGLLNKIEINYDYHFGGYAKKNEELSNFCTDFTYKTGIPIEPVYTGKLFYAIDNLIRKNYFSKGENIVIVHTGGILNFGKK